MNMRHITIILALLIGATALMWPGTSSAWYWCGGAAFGNPDDCWNDSSCSGGGVCHNRQCKCGGDIESKPICNDRCVNRGLTCVTGNCYTVHVTDCRGIQRGDRGGVLSYCSKDACVATTGQACASAPNVCGQTGIGTIQCNGVCSATIPPNPAGYGSACSSAPNACGQTGSGTIQCNGTCSAVTPANPAGYGTACSSPSNLCGMRNNGTIQCNGACSATTPANALCSAPSCSASPANALVGQTVSATGSGGVPGYIWNLGGGTPIAMGWSFITFTYSSPGPKTITVSDGNGKSGTCSVSVCAANTGSSCNSTPNACGQTGSGTIQCNGSCSATVPGTGSCPAPSCAALPSSTTTGQMVTASVTSGFFPPYSWNTGGGVPSGGTGPSVSTIYSTPGIKTFTVSDSNGKSGTCTTTIGSALTATGTVRTQQDHPLDLEFSTDYTVRLTVWDSNDKSSTPVTVDYTTLAGPWVVASFSFTPPQPAAGQVITFTDTSDYGPGSPDGVRWDFGDGSTSSDPAPTHTYAGELANISIRMWARSDIMDPFASDPDPAYCEATPHVLDVLKPIPGYREVRPGDKTSPAPSTQPNNPTGGQTAP